MHRYLESKHVPCLTALKWKVEEGVWSPSGPEEKSKQSRDSGWARVCPSGQGEGGDLLELRGSLEGSGQEGLAGTCGCPERAGRPLCRSCVFLSPSAGPGILGGEESVGETVISTLGKSAILPLEVPVGQEVEKVTWSSRGLVAILRPGPAGKPILVAGTQGPYNQRLSIPHHNYSLQISSLRLQDSGPYRAWITLHSPPINITKDFILHVYGEGVRGLMFELDLPLLGQVGAFS